MNLEIHKSWQPYLKEEFAKPYYLDLIKFVKTEYDNQTCYPPVNQVFNAFNCCNFEDVKVVILGQDPYHGPRQANGLCFSVNEGENHPPSLKNIFKELETSLEIPYPDSGNLMRWANQGVLLLNATLSVRAHAAGSHQKKGWEVFTDFVINTLSDKKENIVFLLWGGYAKKKTKLIDVKKHKVFTSGHPSPLSANRGYWFGNNHFYDTNKHLKDSGLAEIIW